MCRYDFFNDIPHEDRFNRKFENGNKLRFYKGDQSLLGYEEEGYNTTKQL